MDAPSSQGVYATKKILRGPRACITCARAKSRCIAGPAGQEKCERCHRLEKPCSSQTPAPPRKRKEPKPNRVSELERRLQDLTARIESVQRSGAPVIPSPPNSDHLTAPPCPPLAAHEHYLPETVTDIRSPLPLRDRPSWNYPLGHLFPKDSSIFDIEPEEPHQQQQPNGVSPPEPTRAAGSLDSSPPQTTCSHPQQQQNEGSLWPDETEAEAMLAEYKSALGRCFPFTVVPGHMSSAELREKRPFLWKGVMLGACYFDGPRQDRLGDELLREISEAAFVRPQKSLDLLQGLQLLIAWYHYNLDSFRMSNMIFLIRSITLNLDTAAIRLLPGEGEGYSSECLEYSRAFVGTYYMVTATFATNKRPHALMNTSHLAACCKALHGRMEYPTDELVVHLVRAEQLVQSMSQASIRRNMMPKEIRMSQAAFIQGMRDRIQAFAASLPPQVKANPSLVGHMHVAEALVYESCLPELSRCPSTRNGEEADSATAPSAEKLALLSECCRVLHEFMANLFAHDCTAPKSSPQFICLSPFDATYVFVTMFKLISLKLPGWDVRKAREDLRFDHHITRLAEQMDLMSEQRRKRRKHVQGYGGEEVEDTYTKLARKIRNVKDHLLLNWLDSDYATSQVAERVCEAAPMTLADAAQDLMLDLGSGLWHDITNSMPEWDSLFVGGEVVDWGYVIPNLSVSKSAYSG